jgi:hypothetical protein
MSHGIFTLGHMSQYKIIQSFELNVLYYFKIIIIILILILKIIKYWDMWQHIICPQTLEVHLNPIPILKVHGPVLKLHKI